MIDYTNLTACVGFVGQLSDIAGETKAILIEQNLIDSAGRKDDLYYYRPYFVAARQIQRNRPDQSLKAADGAQFTNLTTMVRSLLEEQIALDASLGLEIPPGYSAKDALDKACGCDSGSDESSNPMTILVA